MNQATSSTLLGTLRCLLVYFQSCPNALGQLTQLCDKHYGNVGSKVWSKSPLSGAHFFPFFLFLTAEDQVKIWVNCESDSDDNNLHLSST